MNEEKQLTEFRDKVESIKLSFHLKTSKLNELMEKLSKDYDISSVKDAQKNLSSITEKIDLLEKQKEKLLIEVQEKLESYES